MAEEDDTYAEHQHTGNRADWARIATRVRLYFALIAPALPGAMISASRLILALIGLTTHAGETLLTGLLLAIPAGYLIQQGASNPVVARLSTQFKNAQGTPRGLISWRGLMNLARRIVPTLLAITALQLWMSTSAAIALGIVLLLLNRMLRHTPTSRTASATRKAAYEPAPRQPEGSRHAYDQPQRAHPLPP